MGRNSPTMANRNLPSEIIFEVLTRVPAKSLLRFRCVCKSWRSLISTDPQFVKKHLHRAISDDVNVGCWRLLRILLRAYPYLLSIDFEAQNDGGGGDKPPPSSMMLHFLRTPCDSNLVNGVSFIGSCNGLICLLNCDIDKIIVCNPCTRKFRQLPISSSIMAPQAAYGFGYDSSADDYKVVIASRPKYNSVNNNTEMEVFSLKHNSWKRVKEGIHSSIRGVHGAFLDGSLHWIGSCRESDRSIIVSFKLATEEFCELVRLPPDQGDWNFVTVLGGCLSVVRCHGDENEKSDIWMKKEYGVEASWTKLLTYLEPQLIVVPLYLLKNGELLLEVGGGKLIMYDLKKMTARELDVQGPWKFFAAVTYIETLVSPNGNQA